MPVRGWRNAAVAVGAGVVLAGCGGAVGPEGTGAGSVPFDGRSPLEPPAKRMRVLVEERRPSLAEQMAQGSYSPVRQRLYVASLHHEVEALKGALEAKGVRLRRLVLFGRVWNGFAATVDAADLPRIRSLGLRAEPVRRFYSAAGGGSAGVSAPDSSGGKPAVAVLDTPGHGSALATLLGGVRVRQVRVGGRRLDVRTGSKLEFATTDDVLQGLERTVDPNGDGDTSDHVPIALVGVNSPYAGFADSPEAVGASAARVFGTLVIAPAGNEGGAAGTVGSPAAAPGVVAVGALDGGGAPALPAVRVGLATSDGRALVRGTVLGGAVTHALRAPVTPLAGPSQANPHETGRALGGTPLEYFDVNAKPRARGRVVVVPARAEGEPAGGGSAPGVPSIASRAAAAAEAGAAALLVAEPDASRPLPAIADGSTSIPVIGVRGEAASKALDLTTHEGGLAFVSEPDERTSRDPLAIAPTSSRGPTYALAPKPDLAAPGVARLPGGQVIAGTSVAAARVARAAAELHAQRPTERPDDLAAALVGTARPAGPPLQAGAGQPDATGASRAAVLSEPATTALPRVPPGKAFTITKRLALHNTYLATENVTLSIRIPGTQATVAPEDVPLDRNGRADVTITVTAPAAGLHPGWVSGRLGLRGSAVSVSSPIGLPVQDPPPAPLGPLTLTPDKRGVRFTAGAVTTSTAGAKQVQPLGNLRLELLNDKGKTVKALTPPGGATDLLPGEYAYTLTKKTRQALKRGSYTFRATATGPAGGAPTTRTSPSFAR